MRMRHTPGSRPCGALLQGESRCAGNPSRPQAEGCEATQIGITSHTSCRRSPESIDAGLTDPCRYQQPCVLGDLVPDWLMVNVPQLSPDWAPVGAAETV